MNPIIAWGSWRDIRKTVTVLPPEAAPISILMKDSEMLSAHSQMAKEP